jgi:hypothetical protein
MSLAHEESLKKSKRVAAAWANKRKRGRDESRPLTKWCPAWLRLSADRSCYETIPERAAIVRDIFRDAVAGIGILKIGKRLNDRREPVWGNSHGWHLSYVAKILNNRAVIGEFQPYEFVDGKRRPAGAPIKEYFPRIIDDDLFFRAQQGRSERQITGRGRKGQYVTNLFSGLVICAYCKSKLVFQNKGPKPKGGTSLVCGASKRGLDCVTTGWRYDHFETSFLAFVEQLDLPNFIKDDDSEKRTLDAEIQAIDGRLLSQQHEMEQAYALLGINQSLEFVAGKLHSLQQQTNQTKRQLEEKQAERQTLEASDNAFYESKDEIKSLIAQLQTSGDRDLYKLRSQVSARIKSLVDTLSVAPAGLAPIVAHVTKILEADKRAKPRLIERIKSDQDKRYFTVRFKNGSTLSVYPNRNDPLRFESRVMVLGADERTTRLRTEIPVGRLMSSGLKLADD